jgi:thymidine kinase
MDVYEECGYLEIIKGPMFSGKTTRLLDIYKKYSFCEIETMVINYEKDNRYSDIMLSSHDKVMIPCIKALHLSDIVDLKKVNMTNVDFLNAKVILINEGQFFDDIVDWVTIAVEKYHKKVYICGLNSDYRRNKFGNWLDLETISDNVVMLHSFCSKCKKKEAIFTHRLTKDVELELIGTDCYIPVCRKCYNDLSVIESIERKIDKQTHNIIVNSSNIHYYPLHKS